jgi:hypothetical protein
LWLRLAQSFTPAAIKHSSFTLLSFKDMKASGSRLEAITKELRFQWQQTKEHWADAKSLEFEHRFLEELFVSVDRSVSAIEQLDKLITRIKKDCE